MTKERRLLTAMMVLGALLGIARTSLGQTCSATRALSTGYVPGLPLPVSITVQPEPSTQVYSVEDTPPSGWAVSDISHGGLFDGLTEKVKWGFFFDGDARTLTYTVSPPIGELAQRCFGPGIVSCNDVDQAIVGDECIELAIPTVSEWGLAVMSLLVVTAGTLVLRRCQPAPA